MVVSLKEVQVENEKLENQKKKKKSRAVSLEVGREGQDKEGVFIVVCCYCYCLVIFKVLGFEAENQKFGFDMCSRHPSREVKLQMDQWIRISRESWGWRLKPKHLHTHSD